MLHERGFNPRHKGRDGFRGVMGGPIFSAVHLELHSSRRRITLTLGQDLLDGVVVLLTIVVVKVGLMGDLVQGHMFPTDITLTGTEFTFMSFPELSGARLDAVGVLTNPTDHLTRSEPGFGAVSAHRPGSQYLDRVTQPELMRCRLSGQSWVSRRAPSRAAGKSPAPWSLAARRTAWHPLPCLHLTRGVPNPGGPCRTESGKATANPV